MAGWKRQTLGDIPLYQATTLAWLPGVVQGFSTRHGGRSPAPYDTMNLGAHVGDDPASVEANRRKLGAALGFPPAQVALAEQVHGSAVAVVESGNPPIAAGADALITRRTDVLLMLFFADCVPVYIVDPGSRAIALVHSGWRGTVSAIITQTVCAMRENFGTRPEACLAAIGPCIGGESYEVGQEVVDQFRQLSALRSANAIFPRNEFMGIYTLDLRQVLFSQLLGAGLRAEYIAVSDKDTFRDRAEFFSYRRDGRTTGRMAGFLALRPA